MYRPKFIEVTGGSEPDYSALAEAFFTGVDSHEQAAAGWNAHLDQSQLAGERPGWRTADGWRPVTPAPRSPTRYVQLCGSF